jgi:hypothetical protein
MCMHLIWLGMSAGLGRYHAGMEAEPVLARVRGAALLVLDTTYAQPQYSFPPQLQAHSKLPPSCQILHIPLPSHAPSALAMLCCQLPSKAQHAWTCGFLHA